MVGSAAGRWDLMRICGPSQFGCSDEPAANDVGLCAAFVRTGGAEQVGGFHNLCFGVDFPGIECEWQSVSNNCGHICAVDKDGLEFCRIFHSEYSFSHQHLHPTHAVSNQRTAGAKAAVP